MQDDSEATHISERYMAPFAEQRSDNTVTGIDIEGFVQRLLLFDHCIIPTIWLKDIQILLRIVEPEAFCELIDAKAISFYIDSATVAEIGQARANLGLTGNVAPLRLNEFSFSTIKGSHDTLKTSKALFELSQTDGIERRHALAVANKLEAAMHAPSGLQILAESCQGFYADLRSQSSTLVRALVAERLRALGQKPARLQVSVEEFVAEDFRLDSNLTSVFGLSPEMARKVCLGALLDLSSVHTRLAHMRHFSAILGMNESERVSWDIKVDKLVRSITQHEQREQQFKRVIQIAGIESGQFKNATKLDLRRIMRVRESKEMIEFRHWLKRTDDKSDQQIKDRVRSLRSMLGNIGQSNPGKVFRILFAALPSLLPNPIQSLAGGLILSLSDAFIVEKLVPPDSVHSIINREYPAMFRSLGEPPQS